MTLFKKKGFGTEKETMWLKLRSGILPALIIVGFATLVAPPAFASASSLQNCVNEIRSLFRHPQRDSHVVAIAHADQHLAKYSQSFLDAADEIYAMTKGMITPNKMTLELKGMDYAVSGDVDSIIANINSNNCDPTKSRIVCGIDLNNPSAVKDALTIFSHELGHHISKTTLKNLDPELAKFLSTRQDFQKFDLSIRKLRKQRDAVYEAIKKDGETWGQAKIEAEIAKYHEISAEIDRFEKIRDVDFWWKRRLWHMHDEVFADLISVVWRKDPKAVSKALRHQVQGTLEAREFDLLRDPATWVSKEEHLDLSPVRSHLWFRYLKDALNDPEKSAKIIRATHAAMVSEMQAFLKTPTLQKSSLETLNNRFIQAIDREMAK